MKPFTLHKVKLPDSYTGYEDYYRDLGIRDGQIILCLSEISNMPNHFAVVSSKGTVVYGLHSDMFVEVMEDEI